MTLRVNRNITLLGFVLTAVLLLTISCGQRRIDQSQYIGLSPKGWAYVDTLAFPVALSDSLIEANLTVAVDHSPLYKYRNLWIEITTGKLGAPKNLKSHKDTVEIILSDTIGNWVGHGIASDYQVSSSQIPLTLRQDEYILVRHIMRTDTLRDINRVGIFILDKTE